VDEKEVRRGREAVLRLRYVRFKDMHLKVNGEPAKITQPKKKRSLAVTDACAGRAMWRGREFGEGGGA
jgi:hypothetical protein